VGFTVDVDDLDRYCQNIMDHRPGESRRDLRIRAARHLLKDSEVVYVEGAGWIAAFLEEVDSKE
jgi:transcriptional regulator GlxA family with amidase domain